MKIDYLQRREPFDETLLRTLATAWSEQHAASIDVSPPGASSGGRPWYVHPRFSVYYARHPHARVRAFLKARFRYNARRRRVAQGVLALVLTRPAGLRAFGHAAFLVTGTLPAEDQLLVMPGNNRIRVFDFARGRCRVLLKHGFDRASIEREVSIRARRDGPFPRIDRWSSRFDWFEEQILDAVPISRCPSTSLRARACNRAFDLLEEWHAHSRRSISAADRIDGLVGAIRRDVADLVPRAGADLCGVAGAACDGLARHAGALDVVPVAEVHGDLILSNILVSPESGEVHLIDWERSQERFQWYDHMVFGLRSRYVDGLAARVRAFVAGHDDDAVLCRIPRGRAWRSAAAALFLLEDLSFHLHVNATAPYVRVTDELRRFVSELGAVLPLLR